MKEIFIPKHHDKIGVMVSGGKDSAYLLWLVCEQLKKEKRSAKIFIPHLIDRVRTPKSQRALYNILDAFKEEYPEQEFQVVEQPFVERNIMKTKRHEARKIQVRLITEFGVQSMFGGVTHKLSDEDDVEIRRQYKELTGRDSPPPELGLMRVPGTEKEWIFVFDENMKRVENTPENIEKCRVYKLNPLFVAGEDSIDVYNVYKTSEFLSKKIFPLTESCVCANPFDSKAWTQPCKKCWWCLEKKAIFGGYDGEEMV